MVWQKQGSEGKERGTSLKQATPEISEGSYTSHSYNHLVRKLSSYILSKAKTGFIVGLIFCVSDIRFQAIKWMPPTENRDAAAMREKQNTASCKKQPMNVS